MKKILSITGTVTGWGLTLAGIVIVIWQVPDTGSRRFYLSLIFNFLLIVGVIVTITLYRSLEKRQEEGYNPRCRMESFSRYGEDDFQTLPSIYYKINTIVTVYCNEDGQSHIIGYGIVKNQQRESQTIHIKKRIDAYSEIWEKIKANDVAVLKNTYIIPTVSDEYTEEVKKDFLAKLKTHNYIKEEANIEI